MAVNTLHCVAVFLRETNGGMSGVYVIHLPGDDCLLPAVCAFASCLAKDLIARPFLTITFWIDTLGRSPYRPAPRLLTCVGQCAAPRGLRGKGRRVGDESGGRPNESP